jgi:hypothetical protein
MQSPQVKPNQVRRILALWPPQATDDGDELVRGYLLAVEDYHADDVWRAVDTLIKGTAPGVNPSFRPKPSEVGAECRRQMNLRLDSEYRTKLSQPRLPPPDIERTPEARARMQAKVDQFLADVAVKTEDPALVKRRNEQWTKTNARFRPDMSPEALSRRLGRKAGFTVGDDHEDAA